MDPAKRPQIFNQIYQLELQDLMSLPLHILPAVGVWHADKLDGPVNAWRWERSEDGG